MGNMIIPVNFRSMAPLQHFFHCEVSSLIRRNVVWNTIIVDKAFKESIEALLTKALQKERPIYIQVSVYFTKNKMLPLP